MRNKNNDEHEPENQLNNLLVVACYCFNSTIFGFRWEPRKTKLASQCESRPQKLRTHASARDKSSQITKKSKKDFVRKKKLNTDKIMFRKGHAIEPSWRRPWTSSRVSVVDVSFVTKFLFARFLSLFTRVEIEPEKRKGIIDIEMSALRNRAKINILITRSFIAPISGVMEGNDDVCWWRLYD